MDEDKFDFEEAAEYIDDTSGRHLVVGRLPDRVGLYLLVIEGDTVHIVARVVGATRERQDANASAFLRWVLDREEKAS